jgi:high affinity Mn2+ porin
VKVAILILLLALSASAQAPRSPDQGSSDPVNIFSHADNTRWFVSGQVNIIAQGHPPFDAPYSGANSLHPYGEDATSRLLTLYTGYELSQDAEVLFDVESASGTGISDALGLAGFTNLDVVRNPNLGGTPYIARVMFHALVPLSTDKVESERTPLSLFTRLPSHRLEFRVGKFTMADFFDVNEAGSDSHLQFMNWTVDNNGAYDYAADTRGYTWGAVAEYEAPSWALRFAEALMPTVANGINMQWNLRRAHSENVELDLLPQLLAKRRTAIRLLSYVNHANMGDYRQAVINFLDHLTPVPDITAHPLQVTSKYGFGVNLEQSLTSNLRAFSRLGWNEGQHESYVYTEVDSTLELGGDYSGARWRRKLDKVGAAFVSNGISRWHQKYLALGGRGFLLGDGGLNYGRETIFESYYNLHLWRGVYLGADLQHVNNPGYNRDRGPVLAPGVRLHLDL